MAVGLVVLPWSSCMGSVLSLYRTGLGVSLATDMMRMCRNQTRLLAPALAVATTLWDWSLHQKDYCVCCSFRLGSL